METFESITRDAGSRIALDEDFCRWLDESFRKALSDDERALVPEADWRRGQ